MSLREKMVPCQSNEALISVQFYDNGRMIGHLQHPRLSGKEKLDSLSQMILKLQNLLELESCPGRPLPLVETGDPAGESIANLRIQILFQEHRSWQGKLIWENQKTETVFHSVLELIGLLDEILEESSEAAEQAKQQKNDKNKKD